MPHDCKLGTCLVSEQRHAHARASLLLIICSIHFNRLLACLLPTALSLSLSVCLSLCSVFFFSGVRGQGGVGDRGPDGRDPRRLGPGAGGWVGGSINQHKEWPACRPCPKPCHACMHVANRQFKQLIKSAPCACMHACMHAPSSHTQGPMLVHVCTWQITDPTSQSMHVWAFFTHTHYTGLRFDVLLAPTDGRGGQVHPRGRAHRRAVFALKNGRKRRRRRVCVAFFAKSWSGAGGVLVTTP